MSSDSREGRVPAWTNEFCDKLIKTALFARDIRNIKFTPGQRVRVTIGYEENGLRGAKGVVLGDYPRCVLFRLGNDFGQQEKVFLQKVDILRGRIGMANSKMDPANGGRLKIELY